MEFLDYVRQSARAFKLVTIFKNTINFSNDLTGIAVLVLAPKSSLCFL